MLWNISQKNTGGYLNQPSEINFCPPFMLLMVWDNFQAKKAALNSHKNAHFFLSAHLETSFFSGIPCPLLTPRSQMQPEERDEQSRHTKHYGYTGNLLATVNSLYCFGKVDVKHFCNTLQLSNCWKNLNHAVLSVVIPRKNYAWNSHSKKKHLTFAGSCKFFLFFIPNSCRNFDWYFKFVNYLNNWVYCYNYA